VRDEPGAGDGVAGGAGAGDGACFIPISGAKAPTVRRPSFDLMFVLAINSQVRNRIRIPTISLQSGDEDMLPDEHGGRRIG
jgi:hypothetical protein